MFFIFFSKPNPQKNDYIWINHFLEKETNRIKRSNKIFIGLFGFRYFVVYISKQKIIIFYFLMDFSILTPSKNSFTIDPIESLMIDCQLTKEKITDYNNKSITS